MCGAYFISGCKSNNPTLIQFYGNKRLIQVYALYKKLFFPYNGVAILSILIVPELGSNVCGIYSVSTLHLFPSETSRFSEFFMEWMSRHKYGLDFKDSRFTTFTVNYTIRWRTHEWEDTCTTSPPLEIEKSMCCCYATLSYFLCAYSSCSQPHVVMLQPLLCLYYANDIIAKIGAAKMYPWKHVVLRC